jgi:hypothetical protein
MQMALMNVWAQQSYRLAILRQSLSLQSAKAAIGDMAIIRKAFIGFQSQLYAG